MEASAGGSDSGDENMSLSSYSMFPSSVRGTEEQWSTVTGLRTPHPEATDIPLFLLSPQAAQCLGQGYDLYDVDDDELHSNWQLISPVSYRGGSDSQDSTATTAAAAGTTLDGTTDFIWSELGFLDTDIFPESADLMMAIDHTISSEDRFYGGPRARPPEALALGVQPNETQVATNAIEQPTSAIATSKDEPRRLFDISAAHRVASHDTTLDTLYSRDSSSVLSESLYRHYTTIHHEQPQSASTLEISASASASVSAIPSTAASKQQLQQVIPASESAPLALMEVATSTFGLDTFRSPSLRSLSSADSILSSCNWLGNRTIEEAIGAAPASMDSSCHQLCATDSDSGLTSARETLNSLYLPSDLFDDMTPVEIGEDTSADMAAHSPVGGALRFATPNSTPTVSSSASCSFTVPLQVHSDISKNSTSATNPPTWQSIQGDTLHKSSNTKCIFKAGGMVATTDSSFSAPAILSSSPKSRPSANSPLSSTELAANWSMEASPAAMASQLAQKQTYFEPLSEPSSQDQCQSMSYPLLMNNWLPMHHSWPFLEHAGTFSNALQVFPDLLGPPGNTRYATQPHPAPHFDPQYYAHSCGPQLQHQHAPHPWRKHLRAQLPPSSSPGIRHRRYDHRQQQYHQHQHMSMYPPTSTPLQRLPPQRPRPSHGGGGNSRSNSSIHSAPAEASFSVSSPTYPRHPPLSQLYCHPPYQYHQHLKRRRRLTIEESEFLLHQFAINERPTAQERELFAKHLRLDRRTIQVWFQNRRAKIKRDEKGEQDGVEGEEEGEEDVEQQNEQVQEQKGEQEDLSWDGALPL